MTAIVSIFVVDSIAVVGSMSAMAVMTIITKFLEPLRLS